MPFTLQSQILLRLEYYDFSTTSRNLGISVAKCWGRNQFGVGLKYHFNDALKPLNNVYLRNLISDSPLQSIGLLADYRRYFSKKEKKLNFYFFIHEQFTRKTKKDITPIIYIPSGIRGVDTITRGPFDYLENVIGFGLDIKLSKKLKLMSQIGGGVTLINVTDNGRYITWEFVGLLSTGIAYSFGDSKETANNKRNHQK
jgi:hypothetical protein